MKHLLLGVVVGAMVVGAVWLLRQPPPANDATFDEQEREKELKRDAEAVTAGKEAGEHAAEQEEDVLQGETDAEVIGDEPAVQQAVDNAFQHHCWACRGG